MDIFIIFSHVQVKTASETDFLKTTLTAKNLRTTYKFINPSTGYRIYTDRYYNYLMNVEHEYDFNWDYNDKKGSGKTMEKGDILSYKKGN